MKKVFLLSACAFLLASCNNDVIKEPSQEVKDSINKRTDKPVVKEPEQKPEVKEILPDTKPEEMTKQDKTSWPEDRKDEVMKNCMQDISDMPKKEATAYCSCQLNNLMKIFESYQEAIALYNKSEDQLSKDDMKKVQMVMDTQNTCWEQMMPNDGEEDEKEEMNPEESRSKTKKGKD